MLDQFALAVRAALLLPVSYETLQLQDRDASPSQSFGKLDRRDWPSIAGQVEHRHARPVCWPRETMGLGSPRASRTHTTLLDSPGPRWQAPGDLVDQEKPVAVVDRCRLSCDVVVFGKRKQNAHLSRASDTPIPFYLLVDSRRSPAFFSRSHRPLLKVIGSPAQEQDAGCLHSRRLTRHLHSASVRFDPGIETR